MSHHPLQQPTLDQFSAHTARLARRCNLSTSIDDSLLQIESTNDDPKDDEIAQTPQRSHARAAKSFEEQFAMFHRWSNRDEVRFLDQRSSFPVEADGMWCRICHRFRHFLHTTGKYVTEASTPGHVNSVLNHVKTNIHAQATKMWIQDNEQRIVAEKTQDISKSLEHFKNQFRSVNYICHRHGTCNDFKHLTNLLNSVNNPDNVSKSLNSDLVLFWKLCSVLNTVYEKKAFQMIKSKTPVSLMLDLSTDITFTSVLCVNLCFLSESLDQTTLLLGITEMKTGTKGDDIYTAFIRLLTVADVNISQIVSVSTDGDPAMVGAHTGFITSLKAANQFILHHRCDVHRLQLALKDTFQRDEKSTTAILIRYSAQFVHSITKSHSNKHKFGNMLLRRTTRTGIESKDFLIFLD